MYEIVQQTWQSEPTLKSTPSRGRGRSVEWSAYRKRWRIEVRSWWITSGSGYPRIKGRRGPRQVHDRRIDVIGFRIRHRLLGMQNTPKVKSFFSLQNNTLKKSKNKKKKKKKNEKGFSGKKKKENYSNISEFLCNSIKDILDLWLHILVLLNPSHSLYRYILLLVSLFLNLYGWLTDMVFA